MDDDNDDADGLLLLAVNLEESDLQLELGPPPVSPLGVVTDGVAGRIEFLDSKLFNRVRSLEIKSRIVVVVVAVVGCAD